MREDDFIRTRSGARLFVRDWGAGAPVLLLPGWAMTSDLWAGPWTTTRWPTTSPT